MSDSSVSLALSAMPFVRLANGTTVGNLCSGHPFAFDDGTELPACQPDRVARLTSREARVIIEADPGAFGDFEREILELHLTDEIRAELDVVQRWCYDMELAYGGLPCVVLVPYPYLLAPGFERSRWPNVVAQSLPEGRPQPGERQKALSSRFRIAPPR